MRLVEVRRERDGAVVCGRCALATNPFTRLRGLLGRGELRPGEGILLRPAASVHTAFMRFPIDVVFLDRENVVLAVEPDVPAWRARARRGAHSTLELPAGDAARSGLRPGDRLLLAP